MPAYEYQCNHCSKEWTEYHGFEEKPEKCPFCEQNQFKKVYRYTTMINKLTEAMEHGKKTKVGSRTKAFIEESRKELEEQKESMRGK
jgi:putative FmdB family regulatory protein